MINGRWQVMARRDGNAFIMDTVDIYVKVRGSDGNNHAVLPITLESGAPFDPFTADLPEPTMTISMELAEALLHALASQFYGDNDGNSPGNLISRINRLQHELIQERNRYDKLINALSNLSVMKVTDGNAVVDNGAST